MIRTYANLIRADVRSINGAFKTVTEKHRDMLTANAALFVESADITESLKIRKAAWRAKEKDVKAVADPAALKAAGSQRSQLKTVCILDVDGTYLKAWAGTVDDKGAWVVEPDYTVSLRDAYDALRGKPRRQPSLQEALERAVAKWNKANESDAPYRVKVGVDADSGDFTITQK